MNFTLDLTSNEINIVLSALSKQPYDQVAQLIEKLVSSVNKQAQEGKTKETEGK